MAFFSRFEQTRSVNAPINPQQHVLAVPPLNSVPYRGPPSSNNIFPSSGVKSSNGADPEKAAMVFLPSQPPQEEWENLIAATKGGVGLTGSASMGKIGPVIGLVDIGECEDSYFFRVSLPGVVRDSKDFDCDISDDGKILIKGTTTTGEDIVCKNSQVFKMQTQNLCPHGPFTLSFHLPGPVKHQQFTGRFGLEGVLEGIVKKKFD